MIQKKFKKYFDSLILYLILKRHGIKVFDKKTPKI